ncbi:MAG: hypothetical protein VB108_06825 [Anaerolineaceae bacterium]|nr:hypothetical protein [Anaerolineaceae bacterium]
MNEKQLFSLRLSPKNEFKQNLKAKLLTMESAETQKGISPLRLRWTAASLAVLVVAAFSMFAVPQARASVLKFAAQIGGVKFESTLRYPGSEPLSVIKPEVMPLAQALKKLEMQLNLPAELAQGYTLNEQAVKVYAGRGAEGMPDEIIIDIRNPNQKFVYELSVRPDAQSHTFVIGPGSTKQVRLKGGIGAALTQGAWESSSKQWNPDIKAYQLNWEQEGLLFTLIGPSQESLILLANSLVP